MEHVNQVIADGVATITMDDGKVNALTPTMFDQLGRALDRAEHDDVRTVVLVGRPGVFSAGFDLDVLFAGGPDAERMLRDGFLTAARLLRFPRPVVVACTGPAVAMGSFMVLSGDHRVGAGDSLRIHANEVAIGLTMPLAAVAILRYRLNPGAFDRATVLAEPFSGPSAVAAGFVDETVPDAEVVTRAQVIAARLGQLDLTAHHQTKLRARAEVLAQIDRGIESEFAP